MQIAERHNPTLHAVLRRSLGFPVVLVWWQIMEQGDGQTVSVVDDALSHFSESQRYGSR